VHAVSQQTPSTQCWLPHSAFIEHAVPATFEQVPRATGPDALPSAHELPAPQDLTPQQTPSVQ
jgi:hypothetical protein